MHVFMVHDSKYKTLWGETKTHEKNEVQNKNLHNYYHPLTNVGVEGILNSALLQ